MADETDSKSVVRKGVRVQVPLPAVLKKNMEDGELFSTKVSRFLTGVLALVMAAVMAVTADIPAEAAPIANGIDVSKHQSAINWSQVAASGVQFAFIKIGSLNSGVDPQYMANLAGAQAAGIKTGVYIYSYATSVAQAQQEANLVITWLGNNGLSMPVAYDIEDACMRALTDTYYTDNGRNLLQYHRSCRILSGRLLIQESVPRQDRRFTI
jgi:hypothetical protein